MATRTFEIERQTSGETDVLDLTSEVEERVAASGIRDGIAVVFTPGSTASVTTIEYEEGVVEDLRRAIERMAPRELDYLHDRRWGDGNGYSHVRAAILGPSLAVPLCGGDLVLGTWQQIVLLDFDNRPRRRKVVVQVTGE